VGRLAPEKDVGTLLEAWRQVDERLIVAGDGPDRRRLEAIAPPNVEFVGTVSPAQVNALLQDARALVAPTRCNEGGPRSVIEAYAAGVPVIATALGALPELVDHAVTGLLVPESNVDAWVESVRRLSEDETSLQLGQAAFDRWARLHSPEQGLLALEKAYRAAGAA
jgi:glycosyltransferase involved in cell wall biosynthesis